ncbi:hypothetical protein B0H14DRAFT_3435110 [Mycena olivaceomarginata]|nr:hypothetical protein B0H14DRAFT_3435110 [Mycena olivaceomarginata]
MASQSASTLSTLTLSTLPGPMLPGLPSSITLSTELIGSHPDPSGHDSTASPASSYGSPSDISTFTSNRPGSGHIPASSSGGVNSNAPTATQSANTAMARKHPKTTGAIAGGVVGPSSRWCSPFCYGGVASDAAGTRGWRTTPMSKIAPWTRLSPPTSTTNLIPQPFLAVPASVAPFDISAKQFTDTPESAPIGTGKAPDGPSHSRADRNAIAREKDPVVLPWELPASLPLPALTQRPAVAETREYATPQTAAPAPVLQPPTQTQTQRERDLEEEVQRLREQLADGSPPAYSAKPDVILPE